MVSWGWLTDKWYLSPLSVALTSLVERCYTPTQPHSIILQLYIPSHKAAIKVCRSNRYRQTEVFNSNSLSSFTTSSCFTRFFFSSPSYLLARVEHVWSLPNWMKSLYCDSSQLCRLRIHFTRDITPAYDCVHSFVFSLLRSFTKARERQSLVIVLCGFIPMSNLFQKLLWYYESIDYSHLK